MMIDKDLMPTLFRTVQNEDDGKIFECCSDACRYYFGKTYNQLYVKTFPDRYEVNGKTFKRLHESYYIVKYGDQVKPIPGFEEEYTLSTSGEIRSVKFPGRVKKITKTKSSATVMLSKHSLPYCYNLSALLRLTFEGNAFRPERKPLSKALSNASKGRLCPVKCITDGKTFNSIKEASQFYNLDYSEFRRRLSVGKPMHNLEFEKIKQNLQ